MKKAIMTTFLILVLIFFKVPALAVLSDDPYFYKQDNLQHIGYEAAWAQGLDGRGVRIAVIDSGVYTDHEDLVSTNILPGINLLDRSSNVEDTSGHGTFITGMLVAERNNGIGISGMVDKASVVPLKCFSSGRQTDSRYIVSAIYMAVDEYSCDVINLSLGISENIPALSEAVDYAVDKGVIIIASVGNTGGTSLMYPAAYDNVIGVGSVTLTDTSSYFSQRNTSVFVVAPGEKIISMGTDFKDSYMEGSGTSFSAVHVTALAAIAKQYNRSIDCDAFKELLKDSTVDLGTEGYDTTYGWGLIDVPEFVSQLMQDSISFSDVSDHWAEDNIYSCVSRGLFYGMGNGMFMPNSAMNRAMAVTALYRLDGLPYLEDSSDPFEDVQTGQWFTGAIDWASANAIVSGTGNGKFAPEKTISRQELAVMLYRYARYQGLNLSLSADLSFNDAEEIAPWAKDAVTWAAGNAIVLGRTNGTFDPNAEASRAEVAAVLVRFTELYE